MFTVKSQIQEGSDQGWMDQGKYRNGVHFRRWQFTDDATAYFRFRNPGAHRNLALSISHQEQAVAQHQGGERYGVFLVACILALTK